MPGTPTTAAAPRTPIRTLLSTAIAYVSQKRPAVFLPPESVLPRSAARHLLQPADSVLDRRVGREKLAGSLARPGRVGGHQGGPVRPPRPRPQPRPLSPRAPPAPAGRPRKPSPRPI